MMEIAGLLSFDVNVSIIFTELPLLERPHAAASVGFDSIEMWWPFTEPVPSGAEIERLLSTLEEAGTHLVALNFDAGDMAAGDRGLLSRSGHSARFQDNVDVAVEIARRTGCRLLNALYGNRDTEALPEEQDEVALVNLLYAAKAADSIGATVLIEALNEYENPLYPLTSSGLTVVEKARHAGARNVGFLADLYHLALMGETPDSVLRVAGDRLAHIQIADVPGRGEPGSGSLGVAGLLGPVERSGYTRPVGLEYRPSSASENSFEWLNAYRGPGSALIDRRLQP
jgi:hydroxypyruvate isomerase